MKLKIEEIIREKGLKKGYVSQQLKVNPDTLTNWMKNRSMPKLDQAVKLAKLLDVSLYDLFEE